MIKIDVKMPESCEECLFLQIRSIEQGITTYGCFFKWIPFEDVYYGKFKYETVHKNCKLMEGEDVS